MCRYYNWLGLLCVVEFNFLEEVTVWEFHASLPVFTPGIDDSLQPRAYLESLLSGSGTIIYCLLECFGLLESNILKIR